MVTRRIQDYEYKTVKNKFERMVQYYKSKCYKKSQDSSVNLQHLWQIVIQIKKGCNLLFIKL